MGKPRPSDTPPGRPKEVALHVQNELDDEKSVRRKCRRKTSTTKDHVTKWSGFSKGCRRGLKTFQNPSNHDFRISPCKLHWAMTPITDRLLELLEIAKRTHRSGKTGGVVIDISRRGQGEKVSKQETAPYLHIIRKQQKKGL